jgi:hypothetical protein
MQAAMGSVRDAAGCLVIVGILVAGIASALLTIVGALR